MEQRNFARLESSFELPDLLELQKTSFKEFLQKDIEPDKRRNYGLHRAFLDIFGDAEKGEGLESSNGSLKLQYLGYEIGEPRISPTEAIAKGRTYDAPLKITFRLLQKLANEKIKELSEQEVYVCDIPIITEKCSFIINGAERVIVTQIHRSPGVFFEEDEEKVISQIGKRLYQASIIPYRGAWVDFEFDLNNILFVHIDKKRKMPATVLLRALGLETNEEIINIFYDIKTIHKNEFEKCLGNIIIEDHADKKTGEIICESLQEIKQENLKTLQEKLDTIKVIDITSESANPAIFLTIKADPTRTRREAIDLIYRILHTPDFITPQIAENYLEELLFKLRRYDLTHVGRYKINKKLKNIFDEFGKNKKYKDIFNVPADRKRVLVKEDIVATIKYILNLNSGIEGHEVDDIDHLGNRRIRSVGELLENQIRIGLTNLARFTRERMNSNDEKVILTPRTLVNTTPLILIIRSFFGTSQLSQFMDQTNPLAELTHKRRLSALGPGGLHRRHAGFEVRDIHYTHYGRICPIETPEGPNIGLITSLASYARVNEYGLLETPYRVVKNGKVTDTEEYLTADKEDAYIIAQADTQTDKDGRITQDMVACRYRGDPRSVEPKEINYIDISPMQLVSPSTALIPFLEHDDANRALMGSNMQRQAVPLLITQEPYVATGIEHKIAVDSHAVITAKRPGEVIIVTAEEVAIYTDEGEVDIYNFSKYSRSNQDTCLNCYPIVNKGQRVKKNQAIVDGAGTANGQLALGRNVFCAFMSWEGFNFEDAILISERLVKEDTFTSIHIQEFQVEARDTKIGPEEITRDIPNVGADDLLNLDENGIIRIGAEVGPGDILVGKTAAKGEQQVTMEERLLKAIFGKKAEDVIDVSLRVPPGVKGKVIHVQVLTRWEKLTKKAEKKRLEELNEKYQGETRNLKNKVEEVLSSIKEREYKKKVARYFKRKDEEYELAKEKNKEYMKHGDELPITVNMIVKVYIASKRRIQAGDKLAGRHGNKGVVSKIMAEEDMPYLPDGTPVDVVLSPLSIPSRMNVGQILEAMLGWAGSIIGEQMVCPVFNGARENEVKEMIKKAKSYLKSKGTPDKYLPTDDCRITLFDGRSGEPFKEKITIGNMYFMKLVHLVEDKIHARSTGPYSLITRQPLGGKAQFGGQRIGEMEVWAIEGYGAAHTLQEFLTVKSDDVSGRTRVYEAIIKGETFSEMGVPESFKVLVRELRGVGLNMELLSSQEKGKKGKPESIKPKKEKVPA